MADLKSVVEMDLDILRAVENMEAEITRVAVTSFWFEVDAPANTRLWPSDELNREVVERLRVGSIIVYSAECDEDGDMIITRLRILRG